MIYLPVEALQALTRFQHLAPGDLVLTGTPVGTALSAPPKPVEIIGICSPGPLSGSCSSRARPATRSTSRRRRRRDRHRHRRREDRPGPPAHDGEGRPVNGMPLWPRYSSPDDIADIERTPLSERGLPASTYELLCRAARLWPDRTAAAVLREHRALAGTRQADVRRAARQCEPDSEPAERTRGRPPGHGGPALAQLPGAHLRDPGRPGCRNRRPDQPRLVRGPHRRAAPALGRACAGGGRARSRSRRHRGRFQPREEGPGGPCAPHVTDRAGTRRPGLDRRICKRGLPDSPGSKRVVRAVPRPSARTRRPGGTLPHWRHDRHPEAGGTHPRQRGRRRLDAGSQRPPRRGRRVLRRPAAVPRQRPRRHRPRSPVQGPDGRVVRTAGLPRPCPLRRLLEAGRAPPAYRHERRPYRLRQARRVSRGRRHQQPAPRHGRRQPLARGRACRLRDSHRRRPHRRVRPDRSDLRQRTELPRRH